MSLREFRKVGHWPTLLCALLYFAISSMIWVLVGALANNIVVDFPLSSFEKGILVGMPILCGAVFRLAFGWMADRIGARRTAIIGMVFTIVPLLAGWLWADSFGELLVVGLLLGVAGASFAVALPHASRWYKPQQQGFALGIVGAGNFGTSLAALIGPWLAGQFHWHAVFGLALIPLGIVLGFFVLFAKDSPNQPPPKPLTDYVAVLGLRDTWNLCLFYAVTFGGFVGFASFLSIFFHDHYSLGSVQAGALVALCVGAGSLLRPLGGYLADRVGGISLLTIIYVAAGIILLDLVTAPPLIWGVILFVTLMGLLGLGNGAVFQLVPQRFPKEIGVVTGIVGAVGGVGGFVLPTLFGGVHQLTGSYAFGFFFIALMAFGCVAMLFHISNAWAGSFITKEGLAAAAVHSAPAPQLEPEMAGARAS
ncbi:MAG: NarK/NasA family nitrate transporter [Gemmataceae bacterium]|nr:NarK/NasA family nitrate transporter [Gemmataceae bacterium]